MHKFNSKILLLLFLTPIYAIWDPPYFNQGNFTWQDIKLGHGPATIGEAGCCMTCITSMLSAEGIQINGSSPDPEIMNEWLLEHDGYSDGDDFTWQSIEQLGCTFEGYLWEPVQVIKAFETGYRILCNVMDWGHFVLVKDINEVGYVVMDPAFNRNTYLFQDCVRAVAYSFPSQRH